MDDGESQSRREFVSPRTICFRLRPAEKERKRLMHQDAGAKLQTGDGSEKTICKEDDKEREDGQKNTQGMEERYQQETQVAAATLSSE